jgi:hypothetical protein
VSVPNPPRPPPGSFPTLWEILEFLHDVGIWLESTVLTLLTGQHALRALIVAQHDITRKLIMTQADRLITADAAESQQLADLTTEIASEMADLAKKMDAAPGRTDPKVEAVITNLVDRTAKLASLTANLRGDDAISQPTDVGGTTGPTPPGTPGQDATSATV